MALFLLLLVITLGCTANQQSDAEVNGNVLDSSDFAEKMGQIGLQVGAMPPALTLETLDGNLFDPEVIKEKKVFLNFWATWCEPCRLEMPDMAKLAKEYPDDLAVVAVNLKEDPELVAPFIEELGLSNFHILLDRTGELAEQFQVLALPTTYFLNKDGSIGHKHLGFMNYEEFKQTYLQLN